MDAEKAFNIICQVASQFRGTADEHRVIQEALLTLKPKKEVVNGEVVKTN